jgi:hypothetical protein
VLAVVGLPWITVEQVSRKRGRGPNVHGPWNPGAGDLIVSNWVSWIDILYLAFRFNPVFVLPVVGAATGQPTHTSKAIPSPGRSTGTGSAGLSSKNRQLSTKLPIVGYHQVSLLKMVRMTGRVPPFFSPGAPAPQSLHGIRKAANRPVVVFPECTSSNGRGMIRFANVLPNEPVPIKSYRAFIMCFRYDPPTPWSPTLTHSMPSSLWNPLSHVFRASRSFVPAALSVRLLSLADSPSCPTFITSEVAPGVNEEDQFVECCASLVSQLGKMKRTAMGWEDKTVFMEFYEKKRKLY